MLGWVEEKRHIVEAKQPPIRYSPPYKFKECSSAFIRPNCMKPPFLRIICTGVAEGMGGRACYFLCCSEGYGRPWVSSSSLCARHTVGSQQESIPSALPSLDHQHETVYAWPFHIKIDIDSPYNPTPRHWPKRKETLMFTLKPEGGCLRQLSSSSLKTRNAPNALQQAKG